MPTAEKATGRRLALVVATGSYTDPTLAKLRAPGRDASDLAAVLDDAALGGFEVEVVLDAPAESLRRQIAQFCAQVGPGDLALVYLSCHGVLDDRGRLYYATTDTDRALLSATAVPAAWLNEQLEDCRGRRQILVLDCCHSGAFARGAKGEGGLALGERFEGRGRVVLTGSRGTEYSFEGGDVVGDSASSVFTSALVEGLRSGEADRDGDGMVTVSELYDYAYEAVRAREARQTPTLWTYGAEGDLLVARSPRGPIVEPAPLPEDLAMLLESARPRVREGAVAELADLLAGSDAGRALTARTELQRIVGEDVPSVANAARAALDAAPASAAQPAPPRPNPPAQQPPPPPSPPGGTEPSPADRPPDPASPPAWRRGTVPIATAAIAVALITAGFALLAGGGSQSSEPGVIAVEGSPRAIAVDEGVAWVSRYGDGEVSRIEGLSETESIEVGPRPGEIAAGEGSVWVSVDEGRELARIDPETHEVEKVPFESCSCPPATLTIAAGKLWVGSVKRHVILTFDPKTGKELGRPYHPGAGFEGIFTVAGGTVWAIGNDFSNAVSASWARRIDPGPEPRDRIPLGAGSLLTAVAFSQGTVWIADAGDGKNVVIAFDPDTEEEVKRIKVETGITSDDLAIAGNALLVWDPDAGLLTRIDADSKAFAETGPIDDFSARPKINHEWSDLAMDDSFAWITDPASGTVHKVEYLP